MWDLALSRGTLHFGCEIKLDSRCRCIAHTADSSARMSITLSFLPVSTASSLPSEHTIVILSAAKDLVCWVASCLTEFTLSVMNVLNMTGPSYPCLTAAACGLSTRRPSQDYARLRSSPITAD